MLPATSPAYRGEDFTLWFLETVIVLEEINQRAEEKKKRWTLNPAHLFDLTEPTQLELLLMHNNISSSDGLV